MPTSIKDILKKLFTRNVVVKQLPGGRLKALDINKSQSLGNQKTFQSPTRWKNGRNVGLVTGYGSGFVNQEIEALRKQLYLDYELMDMDALASSSANIYADESSTLDVHGNLILIKTDDERIKKILHNLFYDVLNIEFNMWCWIRTMCKYGDMFLYLELSEEFGVVNVTPIHPALIIREEGTAEDPNQIRFRFEGDGGFYSRQNLFEDYEIAHFRLLGDTNFLPYGVSIFYPGRKEWKKMTLMEDSMLLHRIMRAPERRDFKIDVGNIPPDEVESHINELANVMKKIPYIDQTTGEYNLRFNLENSLEDMFIPVRGGNSGTTVEPLPGLANEGQKDDVEYFKDKFLASLHIPKEYFGYSEGGTKAGLAQIDLRFARTIERVQKIFVSEFYKIAIVHLKMQGFSNEDLLNFELSLSNPSLVFERQKTDVLTAKVDLAKSIREDNLLSDKYIYENIFGFTDDEWKADRQQGVEDAKHKFRLTQILEEGNDPKITGKSFGTPHDISSMQVASKFEVGNQEELKQMYTPDERENNEGKPQQYKSSFETRRDMDFGKDPVGRRDMNQMERFVRNLNLRKKTKQSLQEDTGQNDIEMLNENNILGDAE